MKPSKTKLIYGLIIIISLGVISISGYRLYESMGGFEEVAIYEMPPVKKVVVGKYFKTKAHFEIEEQFEICRKLIASGKIEGDLTVINHLSEALEGNEIEQFVGISLGGEMAEVPVDFEVREMQSKNRYVMFLSMHPLVRKPAKELEAMLLAKAQENGDELRNYFFEIYYPDNSMSLEGWIK